VFIAAVVAVTSLGIDPSHARRIRFSTPTAKAAPIAATKTAPAAAVKRAPVAAPAHKDDGVTRTHFHVMPGVVIRPPNGAAATTSGAPIATSAPVAAAAPKTAIGTAAPVVGASAPSVDASNREETPARPAQRHFVDLNPDPPKLQREIGPPPAPANVTLCYKTATGKCGNNL
jgi:hypothetical protein